MTASPTVLLAEEDGETIVYRAAYDAYEFIITPDTTPDEYARMREAGLTPVTLSENGMVRDTFAKWQAFRAGERPNLDPDAVRKARTPVNYGELSTEEFIRLRNEETKGRY